MEIKKSYYGTMPDGRVVHSFTLTNRKGTSVSLLTLGATLDKFIFAGSSGEPTDIIVGFDDLEGHVERSDYQGVVVGQYANRIGNASFVINGTEYKVTPNDKGNCLHGGGEYSSAVWDGEITDDKSVTFTYTSPDMTNGFPGTVNVKVVYSLSEDDKLTLSYSAVSDRDTVINLTNHAYFNLNGHPSETVLDHCLTVDAERYTPIDEKSIPFGELKSVKGTPFAFYSAKKIGDDICKDDAQLRNGSGYDHNFCIDGWDGTLRRCAKVYSEKSGIALTVFTTLPGVQLYTGNFLKGLPGKKGEPSVRRGAFCLETQYYPDTPNNPSYPSCFFKAGDKYSSVTVFALSAE